MAVSQINQLCNTVAVSQFSTDYVTPWQCTASGAIYPPEDWCICSKCDEQCDANDALWMSQDLLPHAAAALPLLKEGNRDGEHTEAAVEGLRDGAVEGLHCVQVVGSCGRQQGSGGKG